MLPWSKSLIECSVNVRPKSDFLSNSAIAAINLCEVALCCKLNLLSCFFFKLLGLLGSLVSPCWRPFFLMLVHKKEGKEQDTPTSAFPLRYSA